MELKKYLFILFFLLLSCGKYQNLDFDNNYYIAEISGFDQFEEEVIIETVDMLREENSNLFNGKKPLYVRKSAEAKFGDVNYRQLFCQINLNLKLTDLFAEEKAIKYIFLHQIGKCFKLKISENQEDIMFSSFNSYLVPFINEKIPEFSKRLKK